MTRRYRIEFAHTDMGQVMFFGRYIELAHRAYEDFVCEELHIAWHDWFNNPRWLAPLRALSAEYLRPLAGGSEVGIEIVVEKIGASSFTHSYTFVDNGERAAQLTLTSVFVDRATFAKIGIPAEVRKALQGSADARGQSKSATE